MPESKTINYPYLPEGKIIQYVPENNVFMKAAESLAKNYSQDEVLPVGAVIVRNQRIVAIGVNGSLYHEHHECERVKQKCKTGEGYELCEGCGPKNHSEIKVIEYAEKNHEDTDGADLYLWGHWWACKDCWKKIIKARIANVFLLENSEILFNKEHPENIVGRQFIDINSENKA